MKVLLVIASTLAVAFGVYTPYQHYPVIGAGGHPLETPEVQAAKAHHFAAHAEALHRSAYPVHAIVPVAHAYGIPAVAHNGLPLDTPEVAAAKAQHYHDYNVAAQRNGVVGHLVPAGLGYHHAGAPLDTPEVQLAKAAHFAAHAEAASRAHGHYRRRRSVYAYPQHIPVIDAKGVPVETPEVQAAKAHHFAEYAKVASRDAHGYVPHAAPVYAHVPAAPVQHLVHGPVGYHGPYAQIGHDGRVLETPEVQHATAAHLAAHAAARSHYHY